MYKSIFFDLDGTVTQSEFGIIESVEYALRELGIREEDPVRLKRFIGPPLFNAFQELYGLDDARAEEAVRLYRVHYEEGAMYHAPLYEGVGDVIRRLCGEGRRLFLVTAKPTVFAARIIRHVALDSYFEGIMGPELSDTGYTKKGLIERAMACSGEPEYLMVGDRHYDVDGAREAGIHSVGVTYGYGSRAELEAAGATYLIDRPAELLALVL